MGSLWVDYIDRNFLQNSLLGYIQRGVSGITSNPSIFKEAFRSDAYQELRGKLNLKGKRLYEALAISDIQMACDLFKEQYQMDNDGFVSIEVDPAFAHDAASTIEEAKRLYMVINRQNVMIKIPATPAGYIAIKELIKAEIPVNATLIFALDQTQKILKAVESSSVPVVISVFVSRFDRHLDSKLPLDLKSKSGIMNAYKHYQLIENSGNKMVRALFASTGVKDGELDPTYYLEHLNLSRSVITAPPATIDCYLEGNRSNAVLPSDDEIDSFFAKLVDFGVDLDLVSRSLFIDGLRQFELSFDEIITSFE